ncbi:FtsW/RodA/SpoVE family cell cycle protein [Ectobacillus polymachus]|uniref:FtsW/RodA/SpoVE family cell cycle protein n=1 Tax=Ectobacillus polymachus TaxID=1508806 RepID=UPI003A85435C
MKKAWKSLDYSLMLPLIILCAIGAIMVYSASSILVLKQYTKQDFAANHFFYLQLRSMALGFVALIVMYVLPISIWKKRAISLFLMITTTILLVLVLWKGTVVNNAQSWIFGIQPAEFTKLAVIFALARFFAKKHETSHSIIRGVGGIGLFLAINLYLIDKQPDLGMVILLMCIIVSITLCSGIRLSMVFKRLVITAVVWVPLLYYVVMHKLSKVQMARIQTFLNPFANPQKEGFQLIQSLVAINSGGFFGVGLGNSIQKTGYLPEPHTDFIMAVISEELGFFGIAVILLALATLVFRSFQLARKSQDPFSSLVAIGVGSMIGFQVMVNVGGITGLMPLTGVPVPFISYGGSSLLVNMAAVGLLLNISARVKEQQSITQKPKLSAVN